MTPTADFQPNRSAKEVAMLADSPAPAARCPNCAQGFGSTDQMLDHLKTAHLGSTSGDTTAVRAPERDASIAAQWYASTTHLTQRQRTPAAGVAIIVLLLLTGVAALLPGQAPTGVLLLMYMVVVGYAATQLARSLGNPLGLPDLREMDSRPIKKNR
jgi:hypothetical protein